MVLIDLLQNGGFVDGKLTSAVPNYINSQSLPLVILPFIVLTGTILGFFRIPWKPGRTVTQILGILGCISIFFAILPDSDLGLNLEFWTGYGPVPTFIAAISSLLISYFITRAHQADRVTWRKLSFVFSLVSVLVVVLYLPIFIQPPNGLLNFGDTSYHVVDELLAPFSGRIPYSDYSPQYSGALGWILAPLRLLPLSGESVMKVVIIYCNFFGIFLPLATSVILKLLIPQAKILIIVAASLTTCFASGSFGGSSTMLKEFAYTSRLVPVLATLLAFSFLLRNLKSPSTLGAVLTGVLIATSILNNGDVGLAFGLSTLIVVAILATTGHLTRHTSLAIAVGSMFSILAYIAMGQITGNPIHLDSYIGLRSIPARDLYQSFPLHAAGIHVLVISVGVASVATGIRLLHLHQADALHISRAVILLIIGLLLTSMLVRFAIRPIPQGIQALLIPTFIAGTILTVTGLRELHFTPHKPAFPLLLVLSLLLSIPIGASWQFPNTKDELKRISGNFVGQTEWSSSPGRVIDGYSLDALNRSDGFISSISSIVRSLPRTSSIAYFGVHGHTVQLLTNTENALGIPAPESLRFGGTQVALACRPFTESMFDYVLVYSSTFPCGGYTLDPSSSRGAVQVFVRSDE